MGAELLVVRAEGGVVRAEGGALVGGGVELALHLLEARRVLVGERAPPLELLHRARARRVGARVRALDRVGGVGALALNQLVRDLSNEAADRFDALDIPKTKSRPEEVPAWWVE